jgi:diaminopimelate dehydrogenase
MKNLRIGIIGYGNIGCGALEAVTGEPDMEIAGVVELIESSQLKSLLSVKKCSKLAETVVVNKIADLGTVDVALICTQSRRVKEIAADLLARGIHTVDSFDIHNEIPQIRSELDVVAKKNNVVAITAAGWDPGIDSIVRTLFLSMAPKGVTYTNFGPGMSMGHTCAVNAMPGVKKSLSLTVPAGMGIHRRMVYVELQEGAEFQDVETAIKTDPYFVKDRTYVFEVDNVDNLKDMGHGVMMERKGVSGTTHNQKMKFELTVNNPALTSQIMVSAARAAVKQKPGCYTLIEIPAIDLLYGKPDELIKNLV